ncbi:MAG: hypothetical protein CMH56_15960 [Myxococcales bacterium]|nr:hypothetical protein [Myxococcales bacterium]
MVLVRILMGILLGLGLAGCQHTSAVVQPGQQIPLYLNLNGHAVAADGLAPSIIASAGNEGQSLSFDAASNDAFWKKATPHLKPSMEAAPEEAMAVFQLEARLFSFINGRFRWEINGSLWTKTHAEGIRVMEVAFPVFLRFKHENEQDAYGEGAHSLGALLTQQLKGAHAATTAKPAVPMKPSINAIYMVMVDRFYNGNVDNDMAQTNAADPLAFHGGDLEGVAAKLDWIKDLGADAVWLSPVYDTQKEPFMGHGAFHGYWVNDFHEVEAAFGGRGALHALGETAQKKKMGLILDIVTNHVGYASELPQQKPQWFHKAQEIKNWNDETQVQQGRLAGLPDLNQDAEDVYEHLHAATKKLIDVPGIWGLRFDAVRHVPFSYWQRFNKDMATQLAAPGLRLGEMLDGNTVVTAKTLKSGGFNSLFDYPLYYAMVDSFCDGKNMQAIASVLGADRLYEAPQDLVTFVDNHDLPRVLTRCHDDVAATQRLLAFQLAMRGIPLLTYGVEAGLKGSSETEVRSDMVFEKDANTYALIQHLLQPRKGEALFRHGASHVLHADANNLKILRTHQDRAALIAVGDAAGLPFSSLSAATAQPLLTETHAVAGLRMTLYENVDAALLQKELEAFYHVSPQWTLSVTDVPSEGALYLVGNPEQLGGWSLQGAKKLEMEKNTATVSVLGKTGEMWAYKLVLETPQGERLWEKGPNRFWFGGKDPSRTNIDFAGVGFDPH